MTSVLNRFEISLLLFFEVMFFLLVTPILGANIETVANDNTLIPIFVVFASIDMGILYSIMAIVLLTLSGNNAPIAQIKAIKSIGQDIMMARSIVNGLTIQPRPGFIYIMQREDGILKFGRSVQPEYRLKQHTIDYSTKFNILAQFLVPDMVAFEGLALSLTVHNTHMEGGRRELRTMTTEQLDQFVTKFELICKESMVARVGDLMEAGIITANGDGVHWRE